MSGQRIQQPHEEIAVEFLSRESQVPIDEVTRLYANELSKLGVGAHILGFLPILAIRKVREILRQRKTVLPIAA